MGLRLFGSSCSCDIPIDRNPDPRNFVVLRAIQCGKFVVSLIEYPNATNYEGKKILVFQDCDVEEIWSASFIDPHFCDHGHLSPMARFVPTDEGWDMAIRFCRVEG